MSRGTGRMRWSAAPGGRRQDTRWLQSPRREGSSRRKMVQSKMGSQTTNLLLVGSKTAPLGSP